MNTFLALLSIYIFALGVGQFFSKLGGIVRWLFRRSS